MKFFTDLIALSYLEYTKENDHNIAQYYFQEFYKVRPEANAKEIYSKNQFYAKLITKLDSLINKSISKERITIGTETLIQAFSLTPAEIDDLDLALGHEQQDENNEHFIDEEQLDYYFQRPNLSFIEPLWETCDDAATLIYGIHKAKIELKDPISIINPSVDIYDKPMVLRKSKLEYLKKEAVRASEAKTIAELDDPRGLSDQSSITTKDIVENSRSRLDLVVEEDIIKALKIIEPLGGVYNRETLLDTYDMKRLDKYIGSIIKSKPLPENINPFPILSIPNEFIRKTFHKVYKSIGKSNKKLFIDLIHKFEQFENTEKTTTSSKFSICSGGYDNYLLKIKL